MPHLPASQALWRFRVLDLTRVRAGPTCARQLADWVAELPEGDGGLGGPRHGPDFQNHRNKRSLTLDLKHPDGLAIFKRMVESADVVVENFRPDVKSRLGIDYDSLPQRRDKRDHARIRPASQLGAYVRDYAETIAINAPLTVNAVKLCVSEYLKNPEDRDLDACQAAVDACSHSSDYAEGRTAFMEKQRPVFRGR